MFMPWLHPGATYCKCLIFKIQSFVLHLCHNLHNGVLVMAKALHTATITMMYKLVIYRSQRQSTVVTVNFFLFDCFLHYLSEYHKKCYVSDGQSTCSHLIPNLQNVNSQGTFLDFILMFLILIFHST